MNLYEIDCAIAEVIHNAVDIETGELVGDLSALTELQLERNQKLENIGLYIKNLTSDVASLKEEEQALSKRRKVKENHIASLKQYVSDTLQRDGQSRFESPRLVLSFRKSTQVLVEDVDKLPKKYRKISIDADKTAIKAALQAGTRVRGAELVEKQNLQIK